MTAHVIEIRYWATKNQRDVGPGNLVAPFLRWECSCGRIGPALLTEGTIDGCARRARSARNGGARHVAAMERGR